MVEVFGVSWSTRSRFVAGFILSVAVLWVGGLAGCAHAGISGGTEIRVLLYDGTDSVRVGTQKNPLPISIEGGRILVDGQAVGDHWVPKGRGPWRVASRLVRGRIRVQAKSNRIQVLNRVPIEDYVSSIVGAEMSPSWPQEALRAQAVASRTYALHEAGKRKRSAWDVRATSASQVYRGIAAESEETRSATRATANQILTHGGKPILAVFHSTAGGKTATAGEVWGEDRPYLRVVDVVEEDEAPHTYWRTVFSYGDLVEILDTAGVSVGEMRSLAVSRRTKSGRVERLEVRGPSSVEELRGKRLRGVLGSLGLRSSLFDIRMTPAGVAFVGSGYGHGVGMSQWGARAMAERGETYQRILARFYPGARLERWKGQRVAGPSSSNRAGHPYRANLRTRGIRIAAIDR